MVDGSSAGYLGVVGADGSADTKSAVSAISVLCE